MAEKIERKAPSYLYGPVPSRRLGFSLGIDILPYKACSFNCIYCQLGSTAKKTDQRKSYVSEKKLLLQIKKVLSSGQKIDCLTFSGSGEPTLNLSLGRIIRQIKKITAIPVVVLTNSSLLSKKEVRACLLQADIVIPSLDAATPEIFLRVNRPYPFIKIEEVIEGLVKFRREYRGKIWLEVMLVKGVNDSPSHLKKLKEAIELISPDKIQLNTVVRPPAEKSARALNHDLLEKIKNFIGQQCEIIADFKTKTQIPSSVDLDEAICSLLERRPATLQDLSVSLGKNPCEILKRLDLLLKQDKAKSTDHNGLKFYELKSRMKKCRPQQE